jgi:hypothetical protein
MRVRNLLSQGRRAEGLRSAAVMAEMHIGWAIDWRNKGKRVAMRECAVFAAGDLRLLRTVLAAPEKTAA